MPKDAIFSPAFGNRPSHLVGQQNVISSFLEGLEQSPGSRERATVLLGQRGSGKTVLLFDYQNRNPLNYEAAVFRIGEKEE